MTEIPYVYIAVRSDMTSAQKLVQSSHAAQQSGAKFGCPDNCHMVVFEVKDQDELGKFCETAHGTGINYELFYEPDYNLGHTAVCTEPITGDLRLAFRKFQLLEAQIQVQQDNSCHQLA